MKYEIYCDESCWEALYDKDSHQYASIGGVWIPAEKRQEVKALIGKLNTKYGLKGEMKWNHIWMWIKDVLADKEAKMYVGYDSKEKGYTRSKRVSVVKGDYVVVIQLYKEDHARFITAYVADNSIEKIIKGPEWNMEKDNQK